MTIIEEVPKYEFQSLMSSLGGTISLYLGVSIVSAFEVIELLVRFVFGIGLWANAGGERSATKAGGKIVSPIH